MAIRVLKSFFIIFVCFSLNASGFVSEEFNQLSRNPHQEFTSSSNYSIQHWTSREGLPQNSINTIIQAKDGYLWIGTFGGICRFDGLTFEKIEHPKLAYERVITLFESNDSAIWLGTENNGLFRYKNDKVKHFTVNTGLPGNGVNSIFQFENDKIGVLIHDKGICILDEDSIYFNPNNVFPNKVLLEQAIVDKKNQIWMTTSEGVFMLKRPDTLLQKVIGSEFPIQGKALVLTKQGSLLYANRKAIFTIDKEALAIKDTLSILNKELSSKQLIADNEDVWFGTHSNGVFRLAGKELKQWKNGMGLQNGNVSALFKDRSDNIWVGINGGGLLKFSQNLVESLGDNSQLSSKSILPIYEYKKNQLLIATNGGGVYHYHAINREIKKLPDSLGAPSGVWSIAGNEKELWFGTFGEGLYYWNFSQNKPVEQIFNWPAKSDLVNAMIYDPLDSCLLVGTDQGGLFKFKNNSWHTLITENLKKARISQIVSYQDKIYLSTQGDGVIIYETNTGKNYALKGVKELVNSSIRCLFFDTDDNLWIGTYGNGLILKRGAEFYTINKQKGLFDNLISSINEDSQGNLWMSCNRGVFKVKKLDLIDVAIGAIKLVKCKVYNSSHGMSNTETNGGFQPSSCQLEDGSLFYPTMKGVSRFNPKKKFKAEKIESILINSIKLKDSTFIPQNENRIAPQYRDISFIYTAPSFTAPELIRFKYKLEGYDEEWQNNGFLRIINYTNLDPGSYVLKIKAIDSQGVESDKIAEARFHLIPNWYEVMWVRALILLSFLYLGFRIVKFFQFRKLQREVNEQKIKLAELKIGGLNKEITKNKRELTTYTLEVIEKNNLLREIKDNLKKVDSNQDTANLERMVKFGLNEKQDWVEFKKRFTNVDDEFIQKLRAKHPQLTKGQIRLASLIKLGFSSKQIAEFLNITPPSVDVARSKLRKKLNLTTKDSLYDYLLSV